jgi:tRNA(Ile)-lysidine synthase
LAALRGALGSWGALPKRITVALSGGVDSTVLLAALVRLGLYVPIRAAHVHHGLHPDSARWGAHCAALAESLGVGYVMRSVEVQRASGLGLEAAARDARYGVLRELLAPGEWLLTAHHADDQLETLLLRLVRGSGVRGLRGIVAFAPFGVGALGRPLLTVTRAEIEAVAREWRLEWLDDPANRVLGHDRNYLRWHVLPSLRERWPAAARLSVRLAAQMAEAEQILESVAAADAARLAAPWYLPRAVLAGLDSVRQRNLLRHLVRRCELGVPAAYKIDELRTALLDARPDTRPLVRWPTGEGRVFRDALYLAAPLAAPSPAGFSARVARDSSWSGPEGRIALVRTEAPGGLPESWLDDGLTLRFRAGGERLRPRGRAHHHTLKHLFQEAGVVPWMRARVPLCYRGEQLVAVGDLWTTADADAHDDEPRWRIEWTPIAPVLAPSSRAGMPAVEQRREQLPTRGW